MKNKIGIWIMLVILLCVFQVHAWPRTGIPMKRSLNWNFLTEYSLFDGRLILKAKEQLKLTPEQVKKIEKLMLGFKELAISRCAEIKINELHLVSAIKSDQIDRKNIENQIRQISNKKIDLSIAYLNYLLDIKTILIDQQISVLAKIKKHPAPYHQKRPERYPHKKNP
jgi:Spy/CpxP family protein refolding chaperone